MRIKIFITILLSCCILVSPKITEKAFSDTVASKLKEEIKTSKSVAKKTKKELLRLTRKERSMFGELAKIEDDIQDLQKKLFKQEDKLQNLNEQIKTTSQKHQVLQTELDVITSNLSKMLEALWPVHTKRLEDKLGQMEGWEQADRKFTWLSSLYSDARTQLEKAENQQKLILKNLEEQRNLKNSETEELQEINKTNDNLLENKLALLSGIRKIRAQKISREEKLKDILTTINKLNYKLKILSSKKIAAHKGNLPWPVKGTKAVSFNPSAKPPVRGIGLKTAGNMDVKSIFWGKVVHNDTLRGFGRVVIIYHGYNYYSLYAYLSQSFVKLGQEVEKDELIGKSGYYPGIKDTGLYFELRFHQKPVNPLKWLAH